MSTETEANVYDIPDFAFAEFTKKLGSLNKKAQRYGTELIGYEVISRNPKSYTINRDVDGEVVATEVVEPCRQVVLSGVAPKVNNYDFVARIEYLSDGKSTLFHTVPGTNVKIDERFRQLNSSVCEHCNKIRSRRDVFVVRATATGEQKQIGRQCLGDYLGGVSPELIAAKLSFLKLVEDMMNQCRSYGSGGGLAQRYHDHADTMEVLKLTSAYIKMFGWVPKSQADYDAGKLPTAHFVADHFWRPHEADLETMRQARAMIATDPFHGERAQAVMEWCKTLKDKKGASDYELNLATLTTLNLTERRHIGLVASAISAYQRAMNQKVEYAKKNEDKKLSTFVGTVGERLRNVPVVIDFVKPMSSDFGPMTLIKFVDLSTKNIFVWFASGDFDVKVGDSMKITGTVKAHNDYQGIKETQLNRVVMS